MRRGLQRKVAIFPPAARVLSQMRPRKAALSGLTFSSVRGSIFPLWPGRQAAGRAKDRYRVYLLMEMFLLSVISFFTSVVSVVTGGTSLITVPAMLHFGIEPRSAVATNMLALTLMSAGGSLSFRGRNLIDRRRLPLLVTLTLAGSVLGAMLLVIVPSRAMPVIIPLLMIGMVLFSVLRRDAGVSPAAQEKSRASVAAGYAVTFLLAILGGFFSGGYVTILTAAFVGLFGMTFLQSVSTTKIINVFSSLIATIIFIWQGLVDFRLGILLGIVMFAGGLTGGRIALKLSEKWLRRIFLAAVLALAFKTLLYEVFWRA